MQNLIALNANLITKNIPELADKLNIEIFSNLNSTNDYLKNNLNKNNKINICLTEQQTQGRGRSGKPWFSPFGQNIYFSGLFNFEKAIHELAGLTLVVGLAVINTLTELGLEEIKIKWPNDIFYQSKKLAGILLESCINQQNQSQIIIGIGLNVNMNMGDEIDQPWTSIFNITNNYHDRNFIISLLIKNLIIILEQFQQSGFNYFLKTWPKYDALLDKTINLEYGRTIISGTACGINEQGNLLLRHTDGTVRAYSSGEAGIKK